MLIGIGLETHFRFLVSQRKSFDTAFPRSPPVTACDARRGYQPCFHFLYENRYKPDKWEENVQNIFIFFSYLKPIE